MSQERSGPRRDGARSGGGSRDRGGDDRGGGGDRPRYGGPRRPRRKSGTCAKHQRMLTAALKRARHMALLPYTAEHVRSLMSPQARAMAGGPPPPKPDRPPYRPGGYGAPGGFRPAGAPPPFQGAAAPTPQAAPQAPAPQPPAAPKAEPSA